MKKYILLSLLTIAFFGGCKKDAINVDDPNVYSWKRTMYRRATMIDIDINKNTQLGSRVMIGYDIVKLTGAQVKSEKDKMWHESGKIFSYEYEKIQ